MLLTNFLNPCPICKSERCEIKHRHVTLEMTKFMYHSYEVVCHNCGTVGRQAVCFAADKRNEAWQMAIDAWNRGEVFIKKNKEEEDAED